MCPRDEWDATDAGGACMHRSRCQPIPSLGTSFSRALRARAMSMSACQGKIITIFMFAALVRGGCVHSTRTIRTCALPCACVLQALVSSRHSGFHFVNTLDHARPGSESRNHGKTWCVASPPRYFSLLAAANLGWVWIFLFWMSACGAFWASGMKLYRPSSFVPC